MPAPQLPPPHGPIAAPRHCHHPVPAGTRAGRERRQQPATARPVGAAPFTPARHRPPFGVAPATARSACRSPVTPRQRRASRCPDPPDRKAAARRRRGCETTPRRRRPAGAASAPWTRRPCRAGRRRIAPTSPRRQLGLPKPPAARARSPRRSGPAIGRKGRGGHRRSRHHGRSPVGAKPFLKCRVGAQPARQRRRGRAGLNVEADAAVGIDSIEGHNRADDRASRHSGNGFRSFGNASPTLRERRVRHFGYVRSILQERRCSPDSSVCAGRIGGRVAANLLN